MPDERFWFHTREVRHLAVPSYMLGNLPYNQTIWDLFEDATTDTNVPVRVTIHIAVSNSDDIYNPDYGPYGTFAHFYNAKSGDIRQHQEIHQVAYATGDSNGHEVSIEHEGMPGDSMTDAQVTNATHVFAHCVKYFAVPNRIASYDNTTGLAWHRLGVDGNFGPFDEDDRKTWCRDQTGAYWTGSSGKTCPTDNFIDQLDDIYEEAQGFLDAWSNIPDQDGSEWTGGGTEGGGGTPGGGGTYETLLVDGQWGPVTSHAFQVVLHDKGYYSGLLDGDFGSMSVTAMQSWLTSTGDYSGLIDGVFGPLTTTALQSHLYRHYFYYALVDGLRGAYTARGVQRFLNAELNGSSAGSAGSYPSVSVNGAWAASTSTALQTWLANRLWYTGLIDGDFGTVSVTALQRLLRYLPYYNGYLDGVLGPLTATGLQKFLRDRDHYSGLIDGDFGAMSIRALQGFLNGEPDAA